MHKYMGKNNIAVSWYSLYHLSKDQDFQLDQAVTLKQPF